MNHALFEKHYQEQLKLLPEISQQALASFNWISVLLDIGKSYALQLDELEDLQVETMMLLVGLTPADKYEQELVNTLPISRTEVIKLLGDINTKILTPVHDYIINGGPVEQTPLQKTGVEIVPTEDILSNQTSPVKILPSQEQSISLPDNPEQRKNIIEHKLDDIFHETLEHIEHL